MGPLPPSDETSASGGRSSVADRIAALQKKNAQQPGPGGQDGAAPSDTSSAAPGSASASSRKGSSSKVSALAGDLSTRLNMKAMLGGAPPPGLGKKKDVGLPVPASAAAAADPSVGERGAGQRRGGAGGAGGNGGVGDGENGGAGNLNHAVRPTIAPGRRRRRGQTANPGAETAVKAAGGVSSNGLGAAGVIAEGRDSVVRQASSEGAASPSSAEGAGCGVLEARARGDVD